MQPSLDQLIQITRTLAHDNDFVRVVLASTQGEVQFVEVSDSPELRILKWDICGAPAATILSSDYSGEEESDRFWTHRHRSLDQKYVLVFRSVESDLKRTEVAYLLLHPQNLDSVLLLEPWRGVVLRGVIDYGGMDLK